MLDRKKDAREKIQLGGLIVKAGLRETDKAILLGILMDASNRLGDTNQRDRWRAIGKAAFKNDTQKGAAVPDPDGPDADSAMGSHRD
ncbi:conjugal transfer protein TraD [Roseibium aggregatum]|uniref:conjugal transfer protein TraD n=1 Tax=Roseibium aggregatum TaxID=187304 RepID=UPI002B4B9C2B|nr:conjugal transfer protein TraD [Roseibium aggregatum]